MVRFFAGFRMTSFWKRALLLGFLAIVATFGVVFDLYKYLSFDALRENGQYFQCAVGNHFFLSAIIYIGAYTAAVSLSLPGAAFLTVAGGFLFGAFWGSVFAVSAATLGSVVVYWVAETILGSGLRQRVSPFLRTLEAGFRSHAFNYILFLRLVPAFPFWVVNLVAAFAGVPLRTLAAATAVGIVPGTLVFVTFGTGLSDVFEAGEHVASPDIFSPPLLVAFGALGLMSLAPVVVRKWYKR